MEIIDLASRLTYGDMLTLKMVSRNFYRSLTKLQGNITYWRVITQPIFSTVAEYRLYNAITAFEAHQCYDLTSFDVQAFFKIVPADKQKNIFVEWLLAALKVGWPLSDLNSFVTSRTAKLVIDKRLGNYVFSRRDAALYKWYKDTFPSVRSVNPSILMLHIDNYLYYINIDKSLSSEAAINSIISGRHLTNIGMMDLVTPTVLKMNPRDRSATAYAFGELAMTTEDLLHYYRLWKFDTVGAYRVLDVIYTKAVTHRELTPRLITFLAEMPRIEGTRDQVQRMASTLKRIEEWGRYISDDGLVQAVAKTRQRISV